MAPKSSAVADRVRAALAYANINIKASEARIGIHPATMARIVSTTDPRGAKSEELDVIAEACEIPRWFLEYGFAPPADLAEADLRHVVEEQQERLDDLEALLATQIADAGAPFPGGELGRRLQAHLPTEPGRKRRDSGPGTDAQTGSGG